jgi:hypothetical protein
MVFSFQRGEDMSANTDLPVEEEDQTGWALAYVCSHLAYLRALLPDGDAAVALHDLVRSVTSADPSGRDLRRRLDALHRKVQAAGDGLGVWGHAADTRRDLNLPGVSSGPFEPLYLCPIGRCSGRQVDQTTVFPLVCEITGRELDQDVL